MEDVAVGTLHDLRTALRLMSCCGAHSPATALVAAATAESTPAALAARGFQAVQVSNTTVQHVILGTHFWWCFPPCTRQAMLGSLVHHAHKLRARSMEVVHELTVVSTTSHAVASHLQLGT